MAKSEKAPHYALLVEWSDEDQCFVGRCPELFLGGVHGAHRDAVYADLCVAVDDAIEARRQGNFPLPPALSGKTFSGKFVVRIDPALHKNLAIRASQTGESLNNYVAAQLRASTIS